MPSMRVCFVALKARRLFEPDAPDTFGGTEVRAATIARGLARRGTHRVSFVVQADAPTPPLDTGDVVLHFDHRIGPGRRRRLPRTAGRARRTLAEGVRGARRLGRSLARRFLLPRPRVLPFYRDFPADAICVFGVTDATAHVVESVRGRARSVLFLASDCELSAENRPRSRARGPYGESAHLAHHALVHADTVVVQREEQREFLLERFGRDGIVIANPVDLAPEAYVAPADVAGHQAVWIGRADTFGKRPGLCLELARRAPAVRFLLILNEPGGRLERELRESAPDNVEFRVRVPAEVTESYIAAARVLVSTSSFEGFPNAFLQAAKYGVPVLSLEVDPGGMLSGHGCGIACGGDEERLVAGLAAIIARGPEIEAMSAAGRAYVAAHHDLRHRIADLERLLARG